MNIKTVNEITARLCGVEYSELWETYQILDPNNHALSINWTIEDARCREIFRNWWLAQDENQNGAIMFFPSGTVEYKKGNNFSIAKDIGEIACITAIAKERDVAK